MNLTTERNCVRMFAGCVLAAALLAPSRTARAQASETKSAEPPSAPEITETVRLVNATSQNDLGDLQTCLRNHFSRARIYGSAGQYAITIRATPEDMQAAKKMVADLDRPRKLYRLTYSLTESENGKRTGKRQYSLTVPSGGKTVLKQGSRVPIVTGTTGEAAAASQSSQVQYLDVGINIEARIEDTGLQTKFEESTLAEEKSGVGAQDPIIHQTMLEAMTVIVPGKSVLLGSIDVPGSTRHQEIEVVAELVAQ